MRFPEIHGSPSIRRLDFYEISVRLRGGTENQEREARSTFEDCNDSSLEAKIYLIEQQMDGAARETASALDYKALRVAAQQEIALRTALCSLLRNKSSRTHSLTSGFSNQRVQDFWRALPKANFSEDGNVLSLVDNTFFLGSMDCGDKLLIRNCYRGLLERVESHFQDDGTGVIVTGNPGIGKSMMSYLMLYRCSTQNRRVVFRKAGWNGDKAHLFCEDGVFRLEESEFLEELERPDVLYVLVMLVFFMCLAK
eukprot:CAMPEP_0172157412 /NCGR_PEP_ID=MMETSP1050-20130122/3772_1 /TAXON_ID=233186 /ORGANISM="Cryptomonas curvata, Strain CCAP979/52" /LENGTH=252 /DNA_ID=CAMNT_0012826629 /DNA_START=53 /DNA_END=811 /DNA_ORIENTATION=-